MLLKLGSCEFLSDVKSGSDHWPSGIYASKWKESVEKVEGIISNDYTNTRVKTEREYHNVSPENMEDFNEDIDDTINPAAYMGKEDPFHRPPKKRKKQKSRVLHNYSTDSNGKYLCTEDPDICNRTYDTKKLLTGHIKDFHEGLFVNKDES